MAFSFGAPAKPGLFGAAPAAPSLFGQPAAPAAPSLFGAPPAAPPLFGQPAPSLFGQPVAPAQSLFGQQPTTSLFGQPAAPVAAPAPVQPSLFGQSSLQASQSLFGSKPSLFSTPALAQSSGPPLQKLGEYPPASPNAESIETRIEKLKNAWDLSSVDCRFQSYFYNVVIPPNVTSQYGRPPNGTDERAWNKAVRENPDPEKLVPALAVGFPALDKRIQAQTRQNQAHQSSLAEITTHITKLSDTHTRSTSLRTLKAAQRAQQLSDRLLELIAKAASLESNKNSSIKQEEEELRMKLQEMKLKSDEEKAKLTELWGKVGQLKAKKKLAGGTLEWAVADEEGLRQILEILSTQQNGLNHLTKTLNIASEDVEVIKEAFGMNLKNRSPPRA